MLDEIPSLRPKQRVTRWQDVVGKTVERVIMSELDNPIILELATEFVVLSLHNQHISILFGEIDTGIGFGAFPDFASLRDAHPSVLTGKTITSVTHTVQADFDRRPDFVLIECSGTLTGYVFYPLVGGTYPIYIDDERIGYFEVVP